MGTDNTLRFDLRDILHFCRETIDELNSQSVVSVLKTQNKSFEKALDFIEKIIPAAENAMDQDKADLGIRTATIFLIGLWSKLRQGGSIEELKKDDWNSLATMAAENAIMMDPQDYSLLVFDLYRKSIAYAIGPMKENASESAVSRLEEIVSLMNGYADSLKSGDMHETKFIEENLWLSLEAVFLVMTDRMNLTLLPKERRELAEATSALLFQKIRYSLYDKELAAIDECLDYQANLDKQLTERVNAYTDALRDELDEFDALIEKAFDKADFQAAFRGSAQLAAKTGADGILQTKQDIDDYFMS